MRRFFAILTAIVIGCGAPTSSDSNRVCTPGVTEETICYQCPPERIGIHTCTLDGFGYGDCSCAFCGGVYGCPAGRVCVRFSGAQYPSCAPLCRDTLTDCTARGTCCAPVSGSSVNVCTPECG